MVTRKYNFIDKKLSKEIMSPNDSKIPQRWVRNDRVSELERKGWKIVKRGSDLILMQRGAESRVIKKEKKHG